MRLSLSRWWLCALAMCLNFSALSADTIVVQNKQGEIKKISPVSTEKKEQMKKEQKEQTLNLRVVEMTSKIFASTGDGNVWLIEFYTPWCRHCQSFSPTYANIAASFHSSPNEKIRVAKVDCTSEKALNTRFGVKSFPSFFLVDGWSVYEFDKPRSEANLMDFARGGYKKQDPIPFFTSPMGPMGLLQGTLVFTGTRLMGFLQWLQDTYGISPIVAGIVVCGLGIFGGMLSIVLLTILTTPKPKRD